MKNKCKCYFLDAAGQGFTVPCCSLGEDINIVKSICSDKPYIIGVECNGNDIFCDIIKEAKGYN